MSIRAFQVNNGMVTPLADRVLYSFISGGIAGVIKGGCECELQSDNKHIKVTDGWGIIKGCLFQVREEIVEIECPQTSSSGYFGIRLNIAGSGGDADPIMGFFSGVLSEGQSYTPTKDDINRDGTVYEIVLATYDISSTGIDSSTFNPGLSQEDQINSQSMTFPIGFGAGYTMHFDSVKNDSDLGYRVDAIIDGPYRSFNGPQTMVIDDNGNVMPGIGRLLGGGDSEPDGWDKEHDMVASTSWNGIDSNISWTSVGTKIIPSGVDVTSADKKALRRDSNGRWLVIFNGKFWPHNNASIYGEAIGGIGVSTGYNNPSSSAICHARLNPSKPTKVQVTAVLDIGRFGNLDGSIRFFAFQTSGSSLHFGGTYTAIRIGDVPQTL